MTTRKEIIYAKVGCPFTFRFILFVNEVARLSDFDLRIAHAGDSSYDEITEYLQVQTGRAASFPTLETIEGEFVVGADNLIPLFARRYQTSADAEIISYFNAYMAPATRDILQRLHQANARIKELEEQSGQSPAEPAR